MQADKKPLRTVAVLNQKGGSGKTTTAVNVAACLAEQRQRVILVDLDAQGNASHWLDVYAFASFATLYWWYHVDSAPPPTRLIATSST